MNSRALDFLVVIIIAFVLYWLLIRETPDVQRGDENNVHIESEFKKDLTLNKSQSTPVSLNNEIEKSSPKIEVKKFALNETQKTKDKKPYGDLDDSFVPFDQEGNRYITHLIKSGKHLIYHGDVLIGDENDLKKFDGKVIKQKRARKWPSGNVPYILDEDLENYDLVMEAIEYLNLQTNVKFVPKSESHQNFVHITKGETDCYSYAGMQGGKQEVFLTPRCGVREILHEFMHTLGFFHEQNRGDRDEYIQVLWDNIDEVNQPQFKKIPIDFIGVRGRPFDFESIMLYSSYTFNLYPDEPTILTKDGEIIPSSENLLSGEDIHRVNMAYPSIP